MAVINTVRPELPWPYLVEKGVMSPQFEAGDVAKQLTLATVDGKPALRILVDSGSKYGNSTWLRGIGRLTAPDDRRFVEGSFVAVAKQVTIPVAQILDGATVIDEAHGPGGVVAPVRLIVRPDGNLYASFNGGSRTASGGFTGWTPELLVAPFTLGIEHELVYAITFGRDSTVGRLTVHLDGLMVFDRAEATGQVVSGQWQHPYLLSGLYIGSASTPVVSFIRGIAVSDESADEARAALRAIVGTAPEPEPEPEPDPFAEIREELRLEIAELRKTMSWVKVKARHVWKAYLLAGGK